MVLREANRHDRDLLWVFLIEAAYWDPSWERPEPEQMAAEPVLAGYVRGFGSREGDFGLIAEHAGEPVGAAWWRRFTADAPGYGFVDAETPELSIALLRGHRGTGTGTALMAALVREGRERGIARLSLSVELSNPAVGLYRRLGFEKVTEHGGHATMAVDLAPA